MNFQIKLAVAVLLCGAVGSRANIVPNLTSVTPEGSGEYLYDYTVTIDNGTTVSTNDYFTIYDIYGLISSSETQDPSWTPTLPEPDTGVNPPLTNAPDSSSVPNITWTYTGGPSIVGPDVITESFDFLSTQGNITPPTGLTAGFYAYQAIESDNESLQTGASTVSTPQAPEPASVGIVAAGAALVMRRRK